MYTESHDDALIELEEAATEADYSDFAEQLSLARGSRIAKFPEDVLSQALQDINDEDLFAKIVDFVCEDVSPDPNLIDEPTHLDEIIDERSIRLRELIDDYLEDPKAFEL